MNRNRNYLVCSVALTIMILLLIAAYWFWPYEKRSAYYSVPGVDYNLAVKRFAVPIEIFIVESETERVRYSDADLRRILDEVNEIWRNNANITFELTQINRIMTNKSVDVYTSNEDLQKLGNNYLGEKFNDDIIDVIVVRSLKDQEIGGGIAHPTIKAVMISEFENESWAIWNLAHELGHRLNLYDVFQWNNLMQKKDYWLGFNGEYKKAFLPTNLTKEQVVATRDWAYKIYCPEEACIRND